ncbi:MAG TPA: hypothetical protein VFK13_15485 [Gemmatimonadaceae bacterium]|nr:hypothetical protein [Gemmatimonadaceae bacterium]
MLVLALLPHELLLPFRLALSHEDRLILAPDARAIEPMVAEHVPDVLVVDPATAQRAREPSTLVAAITCFPYLPVVVYTSPTPDAMHATFDLARHGVRHIIFRGHDDAPRRVRATLVRVRGEALCERVWEGIRPRFAGAPEWLLAAMRHVFQTPLQFRDVESIARSSSRSRRSLDNWLARLGLVPARLFWIAARVAWAYPAMRTRGYLLKSITKRMGYYRPAHFANQVFRITGMSPSRLRAQVEPEALVAMLVNRLGHPEPGDHPYRRPAVRPHPRRSPQAGSGRE